MHHITQFFQRSNLDTFLQSISFFLLKFKNIQVILRFLFRLIYEKCKQKVLLQENVWQNNMIS